MAHQKKSINQKLKHHQKKGKQLIPPMLQIPNVQFTSWRNNRIPEMLWAILLITQLRRDHALSIFRWVGKYIEKSPIKGDLYDITHTGLSKWNDKILLEFLVCITANQDQKHALYPLLLLDNLPAKQLWIKAIGDIEKQPKWEILMDSVAKTLYHQSQEATDCRWLRVLCATIAEKLKFGSIEHIKEILYYPNYGDMCEVRPFIRSNEGSFSMLSENKSDWPRLFWDECLKKTPCFPLKMSFANKENSKAPTIEHLSQVHSKLIEHFYENMTDTGINPRFDSIFGIGLYTLTILGETLFSINRVSIIARLALRTIMECYITLAYLMHKDDENLWKTYRVYGAGQAKLAYLKFQVSSEHPSFVDINTLEELANEDAWMEYIPINLGHWEKTDLRKMSINAGVKDIYDKYYNWSSTFSHGHWCAVRNTVFETCGNPLHRLHRIPSKSPFSHSDVITDACQLIDKILNLISVAYPHFDERLTV